MQAKDKSLGPIGETAMRTAAHCLCLLLALAMPALAANLYVAPNGSDAAAGTLAAPFATLAQARDVLRAAKPTTPTTVYLRGGTYTIKEPVVFTPADSGTAAAPITYAAYPGEKPILSGGRVLTGWKPYRDKIMMCSLKDLGMAGLRFRQLFYRGERQTIARYPNRDPRRPRTGGFLYSKEQRSDGQVRYAPGAFPRSWSHLNDVEVTIFPNYAWGNPSIPITSLDSENRLIKLSRSPGEIWIGDRFYIQNALEELDAPGEWVLDHETDIVYFQPPDGGLVKTGAVAPGLKHLVLFQGDFKQQQFVEYLSLSHIGLECCEDHGVVLGASRHCDVIGCTLLQVGGTAVVIDRGSSFCRIAGNDIAYPGGHAVAMYDDTASADACTDNIITNNYAHHCGEINVCSFGWGSGICLSGQRNVASHNLVHDTAYNAFNFDGWDNVIEYNSIHHSSLEIDDCGGIYGWTNTRGGSGRNTIRFNRVADSVGYGKDRMQPGRYQSPWMSFGIYLDDYLSHTTVYGNLVYRAYNGCLHLHGGWNNTIENNVFVDGTLSQVRFSNMPRDRPSLSGITGKDAPGTGEWAMSGIVLRHNIMVSAQPQSKIYLASNFEDTVIQETDRNLAWNQGQPVRLGMPGCMAGDAWASWQAKGRDQRSLVADPLFVDPAHDDYRLRADSPALKLGFKPLPIGEMGLVKNAERASWPVVEPRVLRDGPISISPLFLEPYLPIGRAYWPKIAPQVDGKVDAAEWGAAAADLPVFIERLDQNGQAAARPGRTQFLCDEGNLYFAVALPASATGPLTGQMELALQAAQGGSPGARHVLQGGPDGKWREGGPVGGGSGVRFAVARTGDLQTCEWQVPLAALGAAVSVSQLDYLRCNLRFRATPKSPWVGWSSPSTDAGQLGYLVCSPRVNLGAPNLALNGDLTQGTDLPANWDRVERVPGKTDHGSTGPQLQWVKEGRGGARCLRLQSDDATAMAANEYWWAQVLRNPAPGTYIMRYDLRLRDLTPQGENGHFYGEGWANRKEGTNPRYMSLGATPDNHPTGGPAPFFTRRESVFNVLPDTEQMYMLFGLNRCTGTVWIGNVTLEKCE